MYCVYIYVCMYVCIHNTRKMTYVGVEETQRAAEQSISIHLWHTHVLVYICINVHTRLSH